MFTGNIFAIILFCLIKKISLDDQVVDRDDKQSTTNLNDKITKDALEEDFRISNEALGRRRNLENELPEKGRVTKKSHRMTGSSLVRKKRFLSLINLAAKPIMKTIQSIARNTVNERRNNCTQVPTTAQCDADSPYRTADGQCNNLHNPTWGSAMTCQQRLLPAYYEGNSGFRQSVEGGPLPAPRLLSLNLHYHMDTPTRHINHMFVFFGQLLVHDITLTSLSGPVLNNIPRTQCCPAENQTNPECAPIIIERNDPFYSEFGVRCLNFVRSAICSCNSGPRRQFIQVTSFIDASNTYGNSKEETDSLRMKDGTGRLKYQRSVDGELLPRSREPANDNCSFPQNGEFCFQGGDPRINQHLMLATMETVFFREHNRIVRQLSAINPHWDEERLFQEARRIVGAEKQIITYKEYLPIALGNDIMSYFHLWIGNSTKYDATRNPTANIEFTTAALRFAHSMINSLVTEIPLTSTGAEGLFRNTFFEPFDLYRGHAGRLVKGATDTPSQCRDRHVVEDVTNFLFRRRSSPTGGDLAAININRGRDHGIPPYVEMVKFCTKGQKVIKEFNDLVAYRLMEREQAAALRQNYRSVLDVDLWPGILMEIPIRNATVGPTAACIIGMHFNRLKFGDRFYVEHENQSGSFTLRQLEQLRTVTLARLLCLNTNAREIPANAMLFESERNPVIKCSEMRGIDLSLWRE